MQTLAISRTPTVPALYRFPMGKIVLTCVLALVFGFIGAVGAVSLFSDQFQGPQGPTGLTGAPGPAGEPGADGADGVNGLDGARGARGKKGEAGKDAEAPTAQASDLGSADCAGRSVSVITSARITKNKRLDLVRKDVCIVAPPESATTTSAQ